MKIRYEISIYNKNNILIMKKSRYCIEFWLKDNQKENVKNISHKRQRGQLNLLAYSNNVEVHQQEIFKDRLNTD